MREIGEQWIENGRMYKAVSGKFNCLGCSLDNGSVMCIHKNIVECREGQNFIIHDLGPVNEDGCLAEERTGLFPVVENHFHNLWVVTLITNDFPKIIQVSCYGATKQQAIDAWNWRA